MTTRCRRKSLFMIPWKKCIQRQNLTYVLLFMTFLFGLFITYVTGASYITMMSPERILPLENPNPHENGPIIHDFGRHMINTSGFEFDLELQESKQNITPVKNVEKNYIFTQKTRRKPKPLQKTLERSIDGVRLKKDSESNRITRDFQESHFMTRSLTNRLGNNLFQFAALLSCAKRLNYTAFLRPDVAINKYLLGFRTSNMQLKNVKSFREKKYGNYDSNIENLETSKNWTLVGYYQSWRYFYKDEKLIRSSFKFRPNVYNPAHQFVDSFRSGNRTIVGIHVRRGDMTTQRFQRLGFITAPLSYLNKSMNYFRRKYDNAFFIVSSDAIPWCKTNMREHKDTVFSNFTNPGNDMAMLSSCDHVIITSGTFGWWGAWLAGGDVVYYKGFPKPGSKVEKGLSREDYYPPSWIGME